MKHPTHFVTRLKILHAYTLELEFDDGLARSIDLEPVLAGTLYGPLRDPSLFSQVRIDPAIRTIVWPNGADFDRPVMASQARQWANT